MTRWLMGLATVALVGCGSNPRVMHSDGFVHPKHPYMVRDAGGGSRLLPGNWAFANYEAGETGAPETPKMDMAYRVGVAMDNDADGVSEYFEDVERYDVLLVNDVTNTRLFVRTIPLEPKAGSQDLKTLLRSYLAEVGQTGDFGSLIPSTPPKGAPAFATRIVREAPAQLAGRDGIEAVIERADVPPSAVTKDTLWERMKVRLIKPDFKWVANGRGIPAVMMVGYMASAANFNKDLAKLGTLFDAVEMLEDWQVVQLHANTMISECLPQPPAFKLSMTVNPAGKRTEFSVAPEQGEDVRLCIMDLLDKIELAARDSNRSFKVDIAKGLNPLKAKPKPTPPPPPAEPETPAEAPAAAEGAEGTEAPAEGAEGADPAAEPAPPAPEPAPEG